MKDILRNDFYFEERPMKLMYINGEFTKGKSQGEIEVTNPATEEVLDTVPRGTAEDVEAAVRAAKEAFDPWRKKRLSCMKSQRKSMRIVKKLSAC